MPPLRKVALLFARGAARAFYNVRVSGEPVPAGPLIVVANHPNMGADAALLMNAAARPVRFLAKSVLFDIPVIGKILSAVGAIPIYRRQDAPDQVSKNEESFAAVVAALESGDAIGVFPEGISHDEPSIAPLRTGTARICLLAAQRDVFPAIVPIGLTYADKERFRSPALALVAPPVEWADLHSSSASDRAAVQTLTERIDAALRGITVNVDRHQDRFVVRVAERVHASELDRHRPPRAKVMREATVAAALSWLSEEQPAQLSDLHDRLESFGKTLERLHLSPSALDLQTRSSVVAKWLLRTAIPVALMLPLYLAGRILLLPPYLLTHLLTAKATPVTKATAKILIGLGVYLLYGTVLAIAIAGGWLTGLAAWVMYVLVAILTLLLGDTIARSRRDVRRFLVLSSNRSFHRQLLDERAVLAAEIERMRLKWKEKAGLEV